MLVTALFAVLAICGLAASSAFAADEWRLDGFQIMTPVVSITEGLLELTTLVIGVDVGKVDCAEGVFDGSVGAGANDEVLTLFNAKKEEISKTPLVAPSLDCKGEAGECPSLAEVWPLNLPWLTQIELMEPGGVFLDHIFKEVGKEPGYEVVCLNADGTIKSENRCTGLTSNELQNMGPPENDVLGIYSAAGTEKVSCTTGEGDIEGETLIYVPGETLSVM